MIRSGEADAGGPMPARAEDQPRATAVTNALTGHARIVDDGELVRTSIAMQDVPIEGRPDFMLYADTGAEGGSMVPGRSGSSPARSCR